MNFARKTDKVFTIIYTIISILSIIILIMTHIYPCLLYTSDAADD